MPERAKWVQWTCTVKFKKSGNRAKPDGTWGKGEYTIFSIAIPSDYAKALGLMRGSTLKVKAIVDGKKKKKK